MRPVRFMYNSVQVHRKSVFILKYFISNRQVQDKGWGKKAAECLVQNYVRTETIPFILYTIYRQIYGDFFTSVFD